MKKNKNNYEVVYLFLLPLAVMFVLLLGISQARSLLSETSPQVTGAAISVKDNPNPTITLPLALLVGAVILILFFISIMFGAVANLDRI